ncbi:MAG: HAMP domain-containing histidine kinase [Firmicutes bacterium]|nr:HAMP domain-containing histidine kinase [Bacillota bacterium]
MRIKKLTNQFLLNYIIIFLIIMSLGILTVYIYSEYNYQQQNKYMIDLYQFEEDYLYLGFDEALSKQEFQSEDSVMVLTKDRLVVDSYRGYKDVGESFTPDEFQKYIYGSNFENIYVYFPDDSEYMYVIYTVSIEEDISFVFGIVILMVVVFIVALFAYAKYTSKQVILPIKDLVKSVEEIGKGNYSINIDYSASEELNILKDEINNMASTLQNKTEKTIKLQENRKQLIRDLSHDIRTPLTNILGYSDKLVREKNNLSEDQQKSIEIIQQYGNSANTLVNELFELSKLELGESEFTTVKKDINEWIKLKLIDYVNEFESRNIDYDFDFLDKVCHIEINEFNLHRVFDNLLLNTIKYNQNNFSLYLSLKESSKSYKITIADDGIGIPDESLEKVFEPMVRIEDSRNRELGGTGLGLTIVKEIIEKHGWNIQLKSELESYFGKGCTFVITIPKK